MDPKEELRSALERLRKIAASQRARRDQLAAKLTQLESLPNGGGPESAAAVEETRAALEIAEADYQRSFRQLQEGPKLEDELERATLLRQVRALESSDPFDPSAEEVALSNVREAAAELEAELRIGEELSGRDGSQEAPRPDPEARAREELARLKAERKAKK